MMWCDQPDNFVEFAEFPLNATSQDLFCDFMTRVSKRGVYAALLACGLWCARPEPSLVMAEAPEVRRVVL